MAAERPLDEVLRLEQLRDRVARLCALAEPVLHLRLVELDDRRVGLRVVAADDLDEPPVARRALVGDDDPVDRGSSSTRRGSVSCVLPSFSFSSCVLSLPGHAGKRWASCPSTSASSSSPSACGRSAAGSPAGRSCRCPRAIRLRREPSISSGRRRSSSVIERMIASARSSSRSSTSTPFNCLPRPGHHREDALERPHLPHHLRALEEVVERELAGEQPLLHRLACPRSRRPPRPSRSASARRPCRGCARPCGRDGRPRAGRASRRPRRA